MSNNPYQPDANRKAVKLNSADQFVRACILQIGALALVSLLMVYGNLQRKRLEEFGMELNAFSVVVFGVLRFWPFIVGVLFLATFVTLLIYRSLEATSIGMIKTWWCLSISFWLATPIILLLGIVPPTYALMLALFDK